MIFKINEVLKSRNKNMMWLSEVTNIAYPNILKLCKGENKSIKANTIDKICTALQCNIEDILKSESHTKTLYRLTSYSINKGLDDEVTDLINDIGMEEVKNILLNAKSKPNK
ncbi:MAG: helix-turn-helix transcriptional regulator [Bacilli bacterium]